MGQLFRGCLYERERAVECGDNSCYSEFSGLGAAAYYRHGQSQLHFNRSGHIIDTAFHIVDAEYSFAASGDSLQWSADGNDEDPCDPPSDIVVFRFGST